ncbi:MAG: alpha/beta fold hydrolase [Methanobacteriota archaeon]
MQVLDLDLYRRWVTVRDRPPVRVSAIDLSPEKPAGTILFVHGFGGQAIQWGNQLRHFSREYRCVAPDMRGHGASDAPDAPYTMDELAADLEAVVAALHLPERFVVVAHSFGAAIATEYTLRNPGRVERLVLSSCTGDYSLGPLARFAFSLPTSILEAYRRPYRWLFKRRMSAPAWALKRLYHQSLRIWPGWDRYAELALPVLFLSGNWDLMVPQAAFRRIAGTIKGIQHEMIPNAKHQVMIERADSYNRAVQRFLTKKRVSWRDLAEPIPLAKERPWVKHYELGVPSSIHLPHQPATALLESAARRFRFRTALSFYGNHISYGSLWKQVERCAASLQALGVRKGDRVLVLLPNSPQAVVAYFGTLLAGGVVVLSNPASTPEEVVREARDSGAKVLVTLTRFAGVARKVRDDAKVEHVVLTSIEEGMGLVPRLAFRLSKVVAESHRYPPQAPGLHRFADLSGSGKEAAGSRPPELSPEDPAVLIYTGGTTDVPKGVLLSHQNLVANVVQVRYWIPDARDGKETVLGVLPFSHSYGLTNCLNLGIALGARIVLLPTFRSDEVIRSLGRDGITLFPGVPSMYVAINSHPKARRLRRAKVRLCVSGASPLPVEVAETFERLTHGTVIEGFGLTEASPVTHANPVRGLRKPGTIGLPLPSTLARVVDVATGRPLPPGGEGELEVAGPQTMLSYWNRPKETELAFHDDADLRWLRTGDIARMDEDGYFQIIDRKKDMILAGEYNVYPRDVEEVLYEHPKIQEVAVTAYPPHGPTQGVKAYVVLRPGEEISAEELLAFCKQRLADYMAPRWIEFRRELPKTWIGKVWRRALQREEMERKEEE